MSHLSLCKNLPISILYQRLAARTLLLIDPPWAAREACIGLGETQLRGGRRGCAGGTGSWSHARIRGGWHGCAGGEGSMRSAAGVALHQARVGGYTRSRHGFRFACRRRAQTTTSCSSFVTHQDSSVTRQVFPSCCCVGRWPTSSVAAASRRHTWTLWARGQGLASRASRGAHGKFFHQVRYV